MTHPSAWIHEAKRLDGLFAGQMEPSEYEYLIEAGLLVKRWEGVAGFIGLATLRCTQ